MSKYSISYLLILRFFANNSIKSKVSEIFLLKLNFKYSRSLIDSVRNLNSSFEVHFKLYFIMRLSSFLIKSCLIKIISRIPLTYINFI